MNGLKETRTHNLNVKELENNSDWNLVNLKNFRIFNGKVPTSTGLTILTRK